MKNEPLSSGEQGKIFVFTLLMAPSAIFFIGTIPAIFLIFGLFMMKKNDDFSHIETAVKYFKWYMWLALILFSALTLHFGNKHLESNYGYIEDELSIPITLAVIALIYLISIQFLFFIPLRSHSEWVVANGIFSNKPKSPIGTPSGMDIIKGEKLKHYSVADELLKWAKLKEDGHISEEEFNDARKKLLDRN